MAEIRILTCENGFVIEQYTPSRDDSSTLVVSSTHVAETVKSAVGVLSGVLSKLCAEQR